MVLTGHAAYRCSPSTEASDLLVTSTADINDSGQRRRLMYTDGHTLTRRSGFAGPGTVQGSNS